MSIPDSQATCPWTCHLSDTNQETVLTYYFNKYFNDWSRAHLLSQTQFFPTWNKHYFFFKKSYFVFFILIPLIIKIQII